MKPKEIEYLDDGSIMYEGRIYLGPRSYNDKVNFDPKKWFKHWEERINDIKSMKLEIHQIRDIHSSFIHDLLMYGYLKSMTLQHQEMNELVIKLKIAFYEAYNNYRDSRKGLWSFFAGLFANKILENIKFPNIIPIKNANK